MLTTASEKIILHRRRLGLTQSELARAAGISQGCLSRIERTGVQDTTVRVVEAIARALGLGVNDLVGGHGELDQT
jgi:predicted transcriptional regulator